MNLRESKMIDCSNTRNGTSLSSKDNVERVIEEIITSESLYRNSLYKILVNYKPVVNGNRKLATSSLSTLFDILEDICCLTNDFLISLRNSKFDYRAFAECFLIRERQILSLYSDYCSTLSCAIDILSRLSNKDKLMITLKHIQVEGRHDLPLSAELLKPFQHLFTYEILLDKLYKVAYCSLLKNNHHCTMPRKQSTCAHIKVALGRVRLILEEINELKRTKENRARLKELLNGGLKIFSDFHLDEQGELLFEGTVSQINKSVPRHLILLEKCLLVCKKYFSFLIAKHIILTNKMQLENDSFDQKDPKVFTILDTDIGQQFEFVTSSAEQKRLWLKHLRTSIKRKPYIPQCTMYNGYLMSNNGLCNPILISMIPDQFSTNTSMHSMPISIPYQSKLSLYKPIKNCPRRSNSVIHHIKTIRKSTNELGSAPELSEDEQHSQQQLYVRTEWILPPKCHNNTESDIDQRLKSRNKSVLRVHSLKRYVDASPAKVLNAASESIRRTTPLKDIKNANCIQAASA
ncbi:hypothetical protein GJ496_001390 [Pomphorhynchus laevis]|nr:hypothetical protein GJ496_001390 [Pomphorhynchus laevis]